MRKFRLPNELISRTDAHAVGRKHFNTGKPCRRGHIAARFVVNGGCIECLGQYRTGGLLSTAPTCNMVPIHMHGSTALAPDAVTSLRKYLQTCADTWMTHNGHLPYGEAT